MKPAILLLALTSIAYSQGSLTPPGPPGLTMRSLDEIEPRIPLNQTTTPGDATCVFKITKPGSYILTGNIKPPAGKHCMLIALLLPGVVDVDMKGFTIDGSDAGAGPSGVLCNNEVLLLDGDCVPVIHNGTLRNFAGGACICAPGFTAGTLELRDLRINGGGAGVNTPSRLRMQNVSISGGTGIPLQMGHDSVVERVSITTSHAGIPKFIQAGDRCQFQNVLVSSVMGGSTQTSAFTAGQDTRMNDLSVHLSDGIFTGPVLANSSGFSEVSGLDIRLQNVTAPCVYNSYSFGATQTGSIIGTTYGGDGRVTAHNSTFSSAVVRIPATLQSAAWGDPIGNYNLTGTTTTPTVLGVEADNCTVDADITIAPTATVSGAVIDVAASGTTIRASIRGGNVGVRLSSGTGHKVDGCNLIGLLVPAQAIRIESGVTNSLVRNNTAARLAAGGVLVQNNGGSSNFIAPIITTPAQLNANTNPFANIIH